MEQLRQGHLRPSTSPWNTPIFVVKKKSGKYRLLHDLRAVNAQMQPMGALQPGLPSPSMLPEGWHLLIVDLKDCFFTIQLHPADTARFAFTLRLPNNVAPFDRFEWTLLPQGMQNSPTLCQLYVANALQPLRKAWPDTLIYHYMDDILFAQEQPFTSSQEALLQQLSRQGLVIAPEKVQREPAWKYLGWQITQSQIRPLKLRFNTEIQTLSDAQRLMGDLQWLRPVVGISNNDLDILRPMLQGTDPARPVSPTPQQWKTIHKIGAQVLDRWVDRRDPDTPVDLTILDNARQLLGALTQCKKKAGKSDVKILEWLFTSIQPKTTIQQKIENMAELIEKGRTRILHLTGQEPETIYLPIKRRDLEWYLRNSQPLQVSLLSQATDIKVEPLKAPTLRWISNQEWLVLPKRSERPLPNAVTVFTDAGKKSRRAAATWEENGMWKHQLLTAEKGDSLQTLELAAVVWAFGQWSTKALNVISDSMYVTGIVARIEDARIKDCQNKRLFDLLRQLQGHVQQREKEYCILHIRSHKWGEGLGEGNERADHLVTVTAPLSDFVKARESHSMYHQNAKGLYSQFRITMDEARGIVRACPSCSHHGPGLGIGVNPRGLGPCELWQMDVTHVQPFGRLKYVHVTVDTYSKFIWASAQTGEKALHVTRHLTSCFAVMGVPQQIKTDNGPAYTSEKIRKFFQRWGVEHITGIPHSPTGQAIVERANQTLKQYLDKFGDIVDIQEKLAKALFVINYLCIFSDQKVSPAQVHGKAVAVMPEAPMMVTYRDPATGIWRGPAEVKYAGRGYMCVLTPTGTQWVPAKWTRPVPHTADDHRTDTTACNEPTSGN